ncbi:MAG: response regulator [Kofleriaceae bacterium]|nr:response regulator [Kofleriaceae bacterium]MCL4225740.1 response regulator [Myxococcales bacterium]
MPYQILLCDDEPEVRAALRRTLHRFEVTAVASMDEALEVLRQRRFDAVISDFNLGLAQGDGLELLQLVRVLYGDTTRFLVTGNTDVQVAIRALNEGAVHRFFLKPWDDEQLVTALEIALRRSSPSTTREVAS